MNSNSNFFLLKVVVVIAIITTFFYYIFNEDFSNSSSINKKGSPANQSIENKKVSGTTAEKKTSHINETKDQNRINSDDASIPASQDFDQNNSLHEMQLPSIPPIGDTPESGDTGDYGPPPESGDTGDYGPSPESGDTGDYGPPPESQNPGFPGTAPEDSQP